LAKNIQQRGLFILVGFEVTKCSIFSDITPCSLLNINRRFGETSRLHLQGRSLLPASCWFLAWLFLRPWGWERHISPKRQLILNGLRGVIFQQIELSLYFFEKFIQYLLWYSCKSRIYAPINMYKYASFVIKCACSWSTRTLQ
jgi:hypothetical protein